MSTISNDDIRHIAELSKIELTDEEVEKYRTELSKIIDYVEQLADAELDNKDITHQVSGLDNQTRNDDVADTETADNSLQRVSRQQLLDNAVAATDDGYIKVDRVL